MNEFLSDEQIHTVRTIDHILVLYITATIQMGQQSSGISRINQISQSLTLLRQLPGEKIYINRQTDQEYLLITRLAQGHDDLQNVLAKRKELKCCYLPQLIDYGRQAQGYCSDIGVMNILFRHPAKSLAQEQLHRSSFGQPFEEGELMMISYCTLLALQEYLKMGETYDLSINEETLLIDMDGKIVLTDTGRFKEQSSRRHSLRRICSEQGRIISRIAMMQLGVVLLRMVQDDNKPSYSNSLREYVQLLKSGQFISYSQALTHLESIKRSDRSDSTTKLPKSQASCEQTPNDTPIVQLMQLMETREPLRQLSESHTNQGINSFCYNPTKKKENKSQIYKSKFQARKAEAFAEQSIDLANIQQQSVSIRLDEISSIQERVRETEQDEIIDNNNILPDGLVCYQSIQPIARIELFSSNRPQRLKQLVLNQKGIIYEESADQMSSLASHRTHRLRNFSNYND